MGLFEMLNMGHELDELRADTRDAVVDAFRGGMADARHELFGPPDDEMDAPDPDEFRPGIDDDDELIVEDGQPGDGDRLPDAPDEPPTPKRAARGRQTPAKKKAARKTPSRKKRTT